MNVFKQFIVGAQRNPLRPIATGFVAYSILWTVLESSSFLFPRLKPEGLLAFFAMIAIGVVFGIYRTIPKKSTHVHIKSLNTNIDILFGDLFATKGLKVVAVNEYFDCDLGDHVAERSLHGQLIKKCFGGHPASFNALLETELNDFQFEEVQRKSGRIRKYPIGTTPVITIDNERFLLPAITTTDVETLKACCDVPTLWEGLSGLWNAVRNRAGGETVNVPLIGGGLSGIGLPASQLLQLLVLSIVSASKENHIASHIRLILHDDLYDKIDLDFIKGHWN